MTVANQRERILDTALELMADQGAGSTSMRQLAKACDLNVAGIYHYFPSKAELLRSVIEERQYEMRLRELPDIATDLPPRLLMAGLIVEMWRGAEAEELIWRLLLGEGLRGDETAVAVGGELLHSIEGALHHWLVRLFPQRADQADTLVALVTSQLFAFFVERLFRPGWGIDDVEARAAQIAALVFPDDGPSAGG
jgi:AcrR family transcriptional regulator